MSRAGLASATAFTTVVFLGCSPSERAAGELSAMSDQELRRHWEDLDGGVPFPTPAYRSRVRSAGVNRFGQDWGEEHQAWVLQRMIWQGMTAEQLYWSWGNPERKYVDHYPTGTYEHWFWNLNWYTGGSEATLQDGVVIWYRVGEQQSGHQQP